MTIDKLFSFSRTILTFGAELLYYLGSNYELSTRNISKSVHFMRILHFRVVFLGTPAIRKTGSVVQCAIGIWQFKSWKEINKRKDPFPVGTRRKDNVIATLFLRHVPTWLYMYVLRATDWNIYISCYLLRTWSHQLDHVLYMWYISYRG